MSINGEHIRNFRDEVNENNLFRLAMSNVNGKNEFNKICSAMDWIDMFVNGYDLSVNRLENRGHEGSIAILAYIMISDTLVNGVVALHEALGIENQKTRRVFFIKTKKSPNYPYDHRHARYIKSEESVVFNTIETDEDYFKKIRACFGAHAQDIGRKKEKFFASWSNIDIIEKSINVHLYNYSLAGDIIFSIKIDEIDAYITSEYEKIKQLIPEIKNIVEKHREYLRVKIIPATKSTNDELELLMCEAKNRGKEWEQYLLEELRSSLIADVNAEEETRIRNVILAKIRNSLQTMSKDEEGELYEINNINELIERNI